VNDAYIQQNGFGARKYPMRCFFWGNDHDLIATAFERALLETGYGRLEHPMYGAFDVVPMGSIGRRDDLKNAANQSVIEVTFWTSLRAVYPSDRPSLQNELVGAVDGFDVQAAQQFAASTDLTTVIARVNERSTVKQLLKTISAMLGTLAATTSEVNRQFQDDLTAINYGVDVLVGQPLQLALQVTNLIQGPAKASAALASRLVGYRDFARRLMDSVPGMSATDSGRPAVNDFLTTDLSVMAAVSSSALSVTTATFKTRPEAIGAADEILGQFDAAVSWRDARFGELAEVDTGESYQALLHAVSLVAGFAIEQSFALATERRIVLDRPRTIVDLAAELYGSVDDRLDFMIDTNDLSGSEILELPRGRMIAYYV
jgi:prophage DNA circulation protein